MTEWRAADLIRRIKAEETEEKYVDRHKAFDLAIKALEEIQRYREIGTVGELKESNLSGIELAMIAVSLEKLKQYEDLEEQGKLPKLPCAAGDYAIFSNGSIIPVTYVTISKEGVTVGCQNGIRISMSLQFGNWCKGFYKNYKAAEAALKEIQGQVH